MKIILKVRFSLAGLDNLAGRLFFVPVENSARFQVNILKILLA